MAPMDDWKDVYESPPAGAGADPAAIRRLQQLAYWLDDRFRLPGTNMRMGLDGLIGFIPGVGDFLTGALSAFIIAEAWRLGVPPSKLTRMGANLGIDVLVGAIPLVGDVFDIGWKANRKNIALVLRHLEEVAAARGSPAATTTVAGSGGGARRSGAA